MCGVWPHVEDHRWWATLGTLRDLLLQEALRERRVSCAGNDPRVARRQAAAVAVETVVLQSEPLPAAAAAQPDPDRARPGRAGNDPRLRRNAE